MRSTLIGTGGQGIAISSDAGGSWAASNAGVGNVALEAIALVQGSSDAPAARTGRSRQAAAAMEVQLGAGGDGKAKIQVKGKGALLALPDPAAA